MKMIKGNLKSHTYLWDQMLEINFPATLTRFTIPMYYCAGRYDYNTPSELVAKYYEVIEAPRKQLFWFEESAHGINFEEPMKFLTICLAIQAECEMAGRDDSQKLNSHSERIKEY
ncbi:alpha/beta hydrolase [Paenibacillus psychroresistens]|uniref:Alpha/beta hydrolase n=1 Tax=Paenibacillus psychroresistens TaxID=1778678 RepID=A0A6B8RU24_9BACL|nr:alpha/beta hydrolase [Paenibacillus psychroresistens]QGQ99085.1 alpha/beta hydrolase [Paenibacillus psychroresistens]